MRAAGMECGLEDIGTRGSGGVTPYCFVLNTLFEVSMYCNGSNCSWYYLSASDQLDSMTTVSTTQESMIVGCSYTSSCCTGSFSAEMALTVVEKTINDSNRLGMPVCYTPIRAHVITPVVKV
jgi:hypothetical protein